MNRLSGSGNDPDLYLENLRESYRRKRDARIRRERRAILIVAVIAILIFAAFLIAENVEAQTTVAPEVATAPAPLDIDAALMDWVRDAPRHPLRVASYRSEVSEAIEVSSSRYSLPPEMVTAIVCRESSGRQTARGARGELGLMQVHPDTAVRFRCRLGTPAEQIDCGCRVLAHHVARCGTLAGALAAYGSRSGSCKPKPGGSVERMVRDRLAMAKRIKDGGIGQPPRDGEK